MMNGIGGWGSQDQNKAHIRMVLRGERLPSAVCPKYANKTGENQIRRRQVNIGGIRA